MSGTALEKAIGKSTRRATNIDARKPAGINVEMIERTGEFKAAAPNIGNTPLNMKLDSRLHLKTGRGQALTAGRD